MDSSAGELPQTPSRRHVQLQGPRPTALQVNQESHRIRKPPRPPIRQEPVIIYAVSPKIIHTEVSEFKSLVQRLTGLSSENFSNVGDVSPAARLAATERASPRLRDRIFRNRGVNDEHGNGSSDIMQIVEDLEMDVGHVPGVLSPAPAMLPHMPPGFFSPDSDPLAFLSEMSPWNSGGSFMTSPSAFLQPQMLSPMISPDIFENLFEF